MRIVGKKWWKGHFGGALKGLMTMSIVGKKWREGHFGGAVKGLMPTEAKHYCWHPNTNIGN
jgi:hypothetical protein